MTTDFRKRMFCAESKVSSVLGRLPCLHVGCRLNESAALREEDVVGFPIKKKMVEDGPCIDRGYIIRDHREKQDIASYSDTNQREVVREKN